MADEKKITLNFFQLSPAYGSTNPEEAKKGLDAISKVFDALGDDPTPLELSESKVNLYGKIKKKDGFIFGSFVRNQLSNIPPSYDEITNTVTALPLKDGMGLGFPTCFVYDPEVRIIMIESTNNSIGIGLVCNFLEKNTGIAKLDPLIVINPVKLRDFLEMTVITNIHFKIAKVQNGSIFSTNKRTALGQIIHGADMTDTDTIDCSLTRTKRKKGFTLKLEKVRTMVQSLLKYEDTKELKKLVVTGRETDDSEKETINFIEQKLRDRLYVDQKRLIDSFDIETHYRKMEEVYKRHKQALNIYRVKAK